MNCHEIEIKGRTEKFKLTAEACIILESKVNKKLIDYIKEESVTMCVNLLQYMKRFENSNYSQIDATNLCDELINLGWTYPKIITDIIYETLVISGFLEKLEWEKMKKDAEVAKEILEKKKTQVLQNISEN